MTVTSVYLEIHFKRSINMRKLYTIIFVLYIPMFQRILKSIIENLFLFSRDFTDRYKHNKRMYQTNTRNSTKDLLHYY